jgi:hypothetical protein
MKASAIVIASEAKQSPFASSRLPPFGYAQDRLATLLAMTGMFVFHFVEGSEKELED